MRHLPRTWAWLRWFWRNHLDHASSQIMLHGWYAQCSHGNFPSHFLSQSSILERCLLRGSSRALSTLDDRERYFEEYTFLMSILWRNRIARFFAFKRHAGYCPPQSCSELNVWWWAIIHPQGYRMSWDSGPMTYDSLVPRTRRITAHSFCSLTFPTHPCGVLSKDTFANGLH